jgi:hypothetical protein
MIIKDVTILNDKWRWQNIVVHSAAYIMQDITEYLFLYLCFFFNI